MDAEGAHYKYVLHLLSFHSPSRTPHSPGFPSLLAAASQSSLLVPPPLNNISIPGLGLSLDLFFSPSKFDFKYHLSVYDFKIYCLQSGGSPDY